MHIHTEFMLILKTYIFHKKNYVCINENLNEIKFNIYIILKILFYFYFNILFICICCNIYYLTTIIKIHYFCYEYLIMIFRKYYQDIYSRY